MSDVLRAIELAMHFAIVEARGNFRCNEVLYFNQVHCIANLLATSETDRTRVANLHWDFTSSRNDRGFNYTAFCGLTNLAMELLEQ
jgi:hypothetical protein